MNDPDHLNILPDDTIQDAIGVFKHFPNVGFTILRHFGPEQGLAVQRLRPSHNPTGQRLRVPGAAACKVVADGL